MVGMEKNCGKTECLNYIIRRLPLHERKVCVTSIGLDGERTDQVTRTPKPEIVLREGMGPAGWCPRLWIYPMRQRHWED